MNIFRAADRYCKESNWKDLALLKTCLFSMGILVGILISKEKKKTVAGLSAAALFATYLPLMQKLFRTWKAANAEEQI